ncbi:hypothetical protein [Altibacter sp.]|uniref:hypothetical protein n=1 Tax=Altibacter sp. TaxID=2024823 RepID=UPI000C980E41|nr:hypothetical protein [Altibacter sp.]MAP54509.1 hypothetical protein [Altibacter sp.]
MNEVQQHIVKTLKRNTIFSVILILSLAYFFYKGIWYLLLGSYVPFILIALILSLLVWSSRKSAKAFRIVIATWSILVLLWSTVRLLLSLTHQFIKPVPEGHVAGQVGVLGTIHSLLFLLGAIYLWKYRKRIFQY